MLPNFSSLTSSTAHLSQPLSGVLFGFPCATVSVYAQQFAFVAAFCILYLCSEFYLAKILILCVVTEQSEKNYLGRGIQFAISITNAICYFILYCASSASIYTSLWKQDFLWIYLNKSCGMLHINLWNSELMCTVPYNMKNITKKKFCPWKP